MNLTHELEKIKEKIRQDTLDFGLDFFEVIFQICATDEINVIAAREGFPLRYPHWRFGLNYDGLQKQHQYGWGKIYELVINNDPSYAYLLSSNSLLDQKLVISHVYGHSDFFKNNIWFENTNRNMMNKMATNATKIQRYISKFGRTKVETFIDYVLSLDNLLDPNVLFLRQNEEEKEEDVEFTYSDNFSDSLKSFIKSNKKNEPKIEKEKDLLEKITHPEKDILKFLAENSPLSEWQSDVISIIRDEAYYFLPQRYTKIMNEGWASYWHSRLMNEKVMDSSEVINYADIHSGVMYMDENNFNPYKLGIELFRDIVERYNKGQFGEEYEKANMQEKENWDKNTNQGIAKIFEVRKIHNDISFLETFLTYDFCLKNKFFVIKTNQYGEEFCLPREEFPKLKNNLLNQLSNGGSPQIEIVSSNGSNKGELILRHNYLNNELKMDYAEKTMKNIFAIWKRPIVLATYLENKPVMLHFDKSGFSVKR